MKVTSRKNFILVMRVLRGVIVGVFGLVVLHTPEVAAFGYSEPQTLSQCKADARMAEKNDRQVSSYLGVGPGSLDDFRDASQQTGEKLVTHSPVSGDPDFKLSYADGKLAIEAHGARLTDILIGLGHTTGLRLSGANDSKDLVFADRCGAPDEVVADLMNGSDLQYILILSTTSRGMVEEIILAQRELPDSRLTKTARTSPFGTTTLSKAAEGAGENRLRSLADPSLGWAVPSGISASSSASAGGAEPVDPAQMLLPAATSTPPAADGSGVAASAEKQVKPAGAYMQELYRLRQQLPINSGTVPH